MYFFLRYLAAALQYHGAIREQREREEHTAGLAPLGLRDLLSVPHGALGIACASQLTRTLTLIPFAVVTHAVGRAQPLPLAAGRTAALEEQVGAHLEADYENMFAMLSLFGSVRQLTSHRCAELLAELRHQIHLGALAIAACTHSRSFIILDQEGEWGGEHPPTSSQ